MFKFQKYRFNGISRLEEQKFAAEGHSSYRGLDPVKCDVRPKIEICLGKAEYFIRFSAEKVEKIVKQIKISVLKLFANLPR